MTKITLKGNTINTSGELPKVGSLAKDFKLIAPDLSTKTLNNFKGKNLVLNIFPSIDTGTCAASVRNFNKSAANLNNTSVLCISRDLPFAQTRFCGAEGIENVFMLSDFNTGQFGKDYGLNIIDGPLAGLNSRSIVVINTEGRVIYSEQIAETTDEPNYDLALESL
ncbi:MAG: thiol peroxidase [Bacteroidetes bacterium]|jgi:thioredoxin-dependent peroxiredoxin|nr:thiol peroxidase [Bacteroidota bacterium]MBT5528301.1 thiol peroxidase [Cytophagia bacterium]MBT3802709.1 thiol peroxidase [Bacteroidota bacterium]MBT4340164.1 thiol peroxidase [Bacteroidota bacterium]MBT4727552.1 thiol peroxidase [Bacteroidota bacterium]